MGNVKNQHVVPRSHGWAVKPAEGEKASRLFEKRKEAVDYAKSVAKKNNVCMVVHDETAKFKNFRCRDDIKISENKLWVIEPMMAC